MPKAIEITEALRQSICEIPFAAFALHCDCRKPSERSFHKFKFYRDNWGNYYNITSGELDKVIYIWK